MEGGCKGNRGRKGRGRKEWEKARQREEMRGRETVRHGKKGKRIGEEGKKQKGRKRNGERREEGRGK